MLAWVWRIAMPNRPDTTRAITIYEYDTLLIYCGVALYHRASDRGMTASASNLAAGVTILQEVEFI